MFFTKDVFGPFTMIFIPLQDGYFKAMLCEKRTHFIPSADQLQDPEALPHLQNAIQIPLFQH